MELNYQIQTWDFSLRKIALMKITQNIVEDARMNPNSITYPEIIESRATEKAKQLELPSSLIVEIKNMIRPIMEEMLAWYKENGYIVCPILTPHGTVDVEKSARALMDCKDQPASFLFNMASKYCFEEGIFTFGRQLTTEEKFVYEDSCYKHPPIQDFWYKVYKGKFVNKIRRKDLSKKQCIAGFTHAKNQQQYSAMKYFLKKISKKEVKKIGGNWLLPCDMAVKMFQLDQRNVVKKWYSTMILEALLKWPYQHLFLEAAETLLKNLSVKGNLKAATMITRKVVSGYKDFDYKGLFTGFWKINKCQEIGLHSKTTSLSSFTIQSAIRELLTNIFLMRDKDIAFMVFDDIPESEKVSFFDSRMMLSYYKLIYDKKYEDVLLPMMVCKAKYQEGYLKFTKYFLEDCETYYVALLSYYLPVVRKKQWKDNVQEFRIRMSEYETLVHL